MVKINKKTDKKQEDRPKNPKREQLKMLSRLMKALIDAGEVETVNQGLIERYTYSENTEFHTFHGWKEKGKKIKKGSKAFLIWGKPRKVTQQEEDDEYKYWPVCYLFSNAQVE